MKETQINLKKKEMLTYTGLMLTMLLGVITREALALADKFPLLPLEMGIVFWITAIIVPLAILLNFRLFTLELNALDSRTVAKTINAPIVAMSEQAKEHQQVDNIRL